MKLLQCSQVVNIQSCQAYRLDLTHQSINWWEQGIASHLEGDLEQAEFCYRKITPSMPTYLPALSNLGLVLNSLKKFTEAEQICRHALALDPDFVNASLNLSGSLVALGRLDEAEAVCRNVLLREPESSDALGVLGNILHTMGRMEEARLIFLRALSLKPDTLELLIGFGNVLTQMDRCDEAVTIFRKALAIKPDYQPAINNLGYNLYAIGKLSEARSVLRMALDLNPNDVQVLLNFGLVLTNLGHWDEAEASYRKAMEVQPKFLNVLHNLLFLQNYRDEKFSKTSFRDAKNYGDVVTENINPFRHPPNPIAMKQRLRVGLVSGDLMNHPVGYFLDGIIPFLDPGRVELFVYSTFFKEDDLTQRLKQAIPNWRMVMPLSDEQFAQQIHLDGVDVLMDLSGHTARNRLEVFAWKPAPVQVTWLGYFATTGLTAMDYILGDRYNLPCDESHHFVESPWQLPDCYLCFTPPNISITVSPLPALTNGYITFGCFNTPNKMTPTVVSCWARILQCLPNSRLFLKSKSLADPGVQQNILDQFMQKSVHPHQLILEGPSSRDTYYESYHRVDMALDPFPYPGVTTSVDGLWMGVPFITRKGHRFLSHQGESILANAGLANWIANDLDDYVDKAVMFANDLSGLDTIRRGLRLQMMQSPLFDKQRFANNLIQALEQMWSLWQRSQNPGGFSPRSLYLFK